MRPPVPPKMGYLAFPHPLGALVLTAGDSEVFRRNSGFFCLDSAG
jgi:hypothetical protein